MTCPNCGTPLVEGACPRCAAPAGDEIDDARRRLEETRARLGAWRERLNKRLDDFQKKRDVLSAADARRLARQPTTRLADEPSAVAADEEADPLSAPASAPPPEPPSAPEEEPLDRTVVLPRRKPGDETQLGVSPVAPTRIFSANALGSVFETGSAPAAPAAPAPAPPPPAMTGSEEDDPLGIGADPPAPGEAEEAPTEPVFVPQPPAARVEQPPADPAPPQGTPAWSEPAAGPAALATEVAARENPAEPATTSAAPDAEVVVGSEPALAAGPPLEPASPIHRAGATVLDLLFLLLLPAVLVSFPVARFRLGTSLAGLWGDHSGTVAALSLALFVVLQTLYVGAFGRTPGARLCAIRLVDTAGGTPSFRRAFLHAVLLPLAALPGSANLFGTRSIREA